MQLFLSAVIIGTVLLSQSHGDGTGITTGNSKKELARQLIELNKEASASRKYMEKAVDNLMDQGLDIHFKYKEIILGFLKFEKIRTTTPFIDAVQSGNRIMVEILLSRIKSEYVGHIGHALNNNIKIKRHTYVTPLMVATENGDYDMAKLLMDMDTSGDNAMRGFFDPTPLNIAVDQDNYKLVKLFLERGADPDRHDFNKVFFPHPLSRAKSEKMRSLLRSYGTRTFFDNCRRSLRSLVGE